MNKKIKLKGQLGNYMRWPLNLTILLIVMNLWIYVVSVKAGLLMSIFVIIYAGIAFALFQYNRPLLINDILSFVIHFEQIQKKLLREMGVPFALLDSNGKIIWMNQAFADSTGIERKYRKSISTLFSNVTREAILDCGEKGQMSGAFGDKDYKIEVRRVPIDELIEAGNMFEIQEGEEFITEICLFDETEKLKYKREFEDQKLVVGLIYIDNYEEAMESIGEVRSSLLIALVERKINKYISNIDGLVRKMEKDKYFIAIKQKYVSHLQDDKFSLLDEVREVNIGNDMAITLSIGLGVSGKTYNQNYEYARVAIDLALGRGGDQAVIKEAENNYYYGGKSKQVEKTTRVKARVKAHALQEFMNSKEQVVVMGHSIGDVDSFGASIGIYRAAKVMEKKAYIVINEITTSVRPLVDQFMDSEDYEEDMFITGDDAIEIVDQNTALVIVDVNKPSYTECEELLKLTKTIIVLDHHRQGSEGIESAVLSYIEPYASSACEMVAEVLQYFDDGVKINPLEADCMYAGIQLDTNNFLTKTGVRTFEAAAYLKRCGADVTRVRKLFRDELPAYRTKADVVRNAEVFKGSFAISVCPNDMVESPTIIGAQAANELLNIKGIKASFVLTEYRDKIYVSARSIDEVNVQIIMERLGGGGHLNTAGTQMQGDMNEAIETLKQTLSEMLEGGDI